MVVDGVALLSPTATRAYVKAASKIPSRCAASGVGQGGQVGRSFTRFD